MANPDRNFSLTVEPGPLVDEQVKSGRHVGSSEVVREALRRYQEAAGRERVHLDYIQKLAERGEADIAAGALSRSRDPMLSAPI